MILTKKFHGVKREKLNKEARNLKLEKDKAKIAHYLDLRDKVFKGREENVYSVDQLNLVTDLLMLNPEFYTIWNIRRELLTKLFDSKQLDKIKALNDDLKFVMVLFKRYPKCYWIYNHRLWVLKSLGDNSDWKFELGVVSKVLALDQRNFHAWQLRRVITQNMENTARNNPLNILLINLNEFDFTTSKVNNNISNFSAWHNRSKLIPKIYDLFKEVNLNVINSNEVTKKAFGIFKDPHSILHHELKLVNTGMYMDVEDTSVWLYLYWLLSDKLFTNGLEHSKYMEILQTQLLIIKELNELEVSDNGQNNSWCIKSMIFIKQIMIRLNDGSYNLKDEIRDLLTVLIKIDPLRKGRYIDQLNDTRDLYP